MAGGERVAGGVAGGVGFAVHWLDRTEMGDGLVGECVLPSAAIVGAQAACGGW